jgi:protein TonB
MTALRVPFAVGSGGFMTLSLFYVLWMFVSATPEIRITATPFPRVFTRPRPETPVVEEREQKPERKPPELIPERTRIGIGDSGVDNPPPYVQPEIGAGRIAGPIGPPGVDRDPIPLVRIRPDYPPRAITSGTEGWVKVQFSITTIGSVRDAFVVEADPPRVFDDAALKAIARWRYQPRIHGGVATERVGMQTIIRFDLED